MTVTDKLTAVVCLIVFITVTYGLITAEGRVARRRHERLHGPISEAAVDRACDRKRAS